MRLLNVEWYPRRPDSLRRRLHWHIRLWMYSRLANAGRLQIGRLAVTWPMPWHKNVRHDPAYVHGRPSGVLNFMGWYDRGERRGDG